MRKRIRTPNVADEEYFKVSGILFKPQPVQGKKVCKLENKRISKIIRGKLR
jgi:hypothetical protein